MKQLVSMIKKSFLWSYARNTWQWDILCVLILIFIFLSPKSWFASGHKTVQVGAEVIDNNVLEGRIRTLTGQPNPQIIDIRPIKDVKGQTVGYEVDIR